MSDYDHHEMFPLGQVTTPWRKLSGDYVETAEFEGRTVLKVNPEALSLLAAEAFKDITSEDELAFEAMWKDRIITGSPETCIAEFKRWSAATGSNYFLLRLRHAHSGGPSHMEIMKAIERFGRDVIPHLGNARSGD